MRSSELKKPHSYIKRIKVRVFNGEVATWKGDRESWLLVLECGHKLALLANFYSPKIAAYYCPECERLDAVRRSLTDFTPSA